MRRGNVDRGSKTPVSNDIPARFFLSTFRFRFLSFYRRRLLGESLALLVKERPSSLDAMDENQDLNFGHSCI